MLENALVKKRALRFLLGSMALLVAGLLIYEGIALYRAKQRTPAVIARATAGELPLQLLSSRRRAMLLKVEDPGFYEHRGIDFSTPGQGKTTMTQSLVKIFYFEDFEPGFAKIEQSLIARFVFDPAMSKDAQLAAFLNHARFGSRRGRPVTGFADASRTFYGREFAALTDRQFLSLVAMLMAPKKLDPLRHPQANAERVRRIEALLAGRCRPAGLSDVTYQACKAAARPV
jgi:membrane carboxypeptidase/penicillin-binding protein